ncbi:MAG: hypothetical protein L3J17_13895 [Candidatus Jettenia sp.]|nr:MAG: hypothetical protein L3J17_13895 [Candidatus Jettenia sp.]
MLIDLIRCYWRPANHNQSPLTPYQTHRFSVRELDSYEYSRNRIITSIITDFYEEILLVNSILCQF